MKTINQILTAMLMTCSIISMTNAQDNSKKGADNTTHTSEQKNAIFSEIMLSMPKEMQKRIDSASASSNNEVNSNKKTEKVQKDGSSEKQHALDELPADVREKVQQRMAEIENNNEKRTIQLKEQIMEQKRKQGSKP